MGVFLLSKWYMDCVSEEGEVVVLYTARLRWHAVTLHYASLLTRSADGEPRTETSMRATSEPEIAGDALSWSAPALDVAGTWSSLAAPSRATVYESPDGKVEWQCFGARARAEITHRGRVVRGLGYAERLDLDVEPWGMPIDQLRWGRFVGERSSLVWIDWRGAHEKHLVFHDGAAIGPASIDDRAVVAERDGVRLSIEAGGALRRGAIGGTALAQVPGIDRFPARILALDEQKWCARGTLEDERGQDKGWVVHEVVRWPAQKAEAPSGHFAGKLLYGLLFAAVLPALLFAWARGTERWVHAPAWHSAEVGAAMLGAGALVMIAGWFALWRFGGGLPMNAFPPPRFVARGVYGIVSHPIYVGFVAICFGASIYAGSASGLWLVAPAVALGAIALVLGYEQWDLDARFGDARPAPWLALAPASGTAPTLAQRLAAIVLGVAPWIALALHARPLSPRDAGAYLVAVTAPFAVRSQRGLRTLVMRTLLAMPLLLPLHLVVPSLSPSLLAFLALLGVDAWTASTKWATWPGRVLALVLAYGELAPDRAGTAGVTASAVAYLAVANAGAIWNVLRAASERVANSWHETRVGPVRFINYGLWAALASGGGIVIIGSCLGPGHFAMLAVGASGGLIGAGIWAQTIEGSAALSRPFGFYGGLLGICASAIAAPLLGTPIWLLLGSVAVSAPFIQAMGRVRCFVNGCCHGSPTSDAIGIRYHHPRSRVCRIAHLDDVPIHPTQLYSILWNVVTMVVIARLWSLHAAMHFVGGLYFILNGLGRFVEEAYRGEPQTPIYARLRLYQWVALLQVAAGALITVLGVSGPAPTPQINVAAIAAGLIFGSIYGSAMGIDFPDSKRRLSRLA